MTARRRSRRPVTVPELQNWAREVESTVLKVRPRFLFEDIQELDTSTLKEPGKATPYLDPKHICAYDGPVKGCLCEETK